MELTQRKRIRLKGYNYSSPGAYFVTVCVKNRAEILSNVIPPKNLISPPQNVLTWHGEIADKYINEINYHCKNINVEKYIIMPNHIHFILNVLPVENNIADIKAQQSAIANFVGTFKRFTGKEYGELVWQRGSNDHIIRNDEEYSRIWNYIEHNASKWEQDELNINNKR